MTGTSALCPFADLAQHVEAIESGHHHVQHDGVDPAACQHVQAGAAVGGGAHREAARSEVLGEQLGDPCVVVDHQHGLHGLILCAGTAGPQPRLAWECERL